MEKVAFLRDIESELHYAQQLELVWSNLIDQIKELLENPDNDSDVVLYREMHSVYRTMCLVRGDMADRRRRIADDDLLQRDRRRKIWGKQEELRDRAVGLADKVVDEDRAKEKLRSQGKSGDLSSDPPVGRHGKISDRMKDARRKRR